jgi:hypothetical protein
MPDDRLRRSSGSPEFPMSAKPDDRLLVCGLFGRVECAAAVACMSCTRYFVCLLDLLLFANA